MAPLQKILFILLILGFQAAKGQSITLSNTSWSASIASGNLITNAGENYATTQILSATNQTYLDINALLLWTITVQRTDALWHSNLGLSLRRTGNGSTLVAITSPAVNAWINVTTTPNTLMSGTSVLTGIHNIPLQYRIDGLSVLIPAKSYSTTITYTISGL
ncbi:hypothetical protein LAG90_11675 [Marinilongibacter aquaticus]|uniref:hypothetical protein n=1 Tax=Marinilongibacter aquaticus TaxID=2975157 RepID=UPI0021BD84BF|nr:hypothetical protein [Marinilongibacter aquaticus]UBM57478.1 hypothetical protein LAG90_11675 [Marinilongibacter aquaticus]